MEWAGVTAHDETRTVLKVGDVGVARINERLDGSWFVWLWYYRDEADKVIRDCSRFEQGRAGAEVWARRHLDTLLAEAAVIGSKWAVLPQPGSNRACEHVAVRMITHGDDPRYERWRVLACGCQPSRPLTDRLSRGNSADGGSDMRTKSSITKNSDEQILAAAEAILLKRLERQGKIPEPSEAATFGHGSRTASARSSGAFYLIPATRSSPARCNC